MRPAHERYFFVHLMKTGGTTLRRQIASNFERDEIYPNPELDESRITAYAFIDSLRDLSQERKARIRVYSGHFPFVATEIVGGDFFTLTILRDPVDRTISYLKQRQRNHAPDEPIEAIYENPDVFHGFVHNWQSKMFAMTLDDPLVSFMDRVDVDDDRFALAKANLASVDLIGIQERFGEFLESVERRLGWRVEYDMMLLKSASLECSTAFRNRIAQDNERDVELYEYACALQQEGDAGRREVPGAAARS